jgi:H+/Cl- antiporter ClcA
MLFGGLLGHAWVALWPGTSVGSYALIGGGAVLAASMQGPLAAVVLILELAHHTDSLIVPLLLAITSATVIARRLGAPSIYSARLGQQAPVASEQEPSDDFPRSDDRLAKRPAPSDTAGAQVNDEP